MSGRTNAEAGAVGDLFLLRKREQRRKPAGKIKLSSLIVASACLALLCAPPARLHAATITVTSAADTGPGTLRAALAGAVTGDTIDATGLSGRITLTGGQLTVSNSVTLIGPGLGTLTVSGTNATRVFDVTATNVTISGLMIANGQGALYGAGIRTSGGAGSVVTLSDCVVTNNSTTLLGAGIFNSQGVTLVVSNCTISGNRAPSGNAGGIYNSNATLIVVASTLSGNSAYQVGGGIMNDGQYGSATLTISASTFSSNSAWSGGGILNYGSSGIATLTISASTFSGNSAGYAGGSIQNSGWYGTAAVKIGDTILSAGASGGNILNDRGTVTSRGYNLSSDGGGGFLTATGDQTNTAPLLGPLQNNGGPTWTHALLTGSPAIDQGKSDAVPSLTRATDQRGAARISDLPTVPNAADGSDIGAFEFPYVPNQSLYTTPYRFTTFAGNPPSGSADGVGNNAQFWKPYALAVDTNGTVYVADTFNHTIRKITAAGVVSTLAGRPGASGTNDGTGSNARFFHPSGVAVDRAGTVYVTDGENHDIRKITPAGLVSTLAGLPGVSGANDGAGGDARFSAPCGVAMDSGGILYVADTYNHTIRKITPTGVVSTLAGVAGTFGTDDGPGAAARFCLPWGIAVGPGDTIYVGDNQNNTIRKITAAGVVSTWAGAPKASGTNDGPAGIARFYRPCGVAVDSAGNAYVADKINDTIRKITPAGIVSTLAGLGEADGSVDGTGSTARFDYPYGVAVDTAGTVYVADTLNSTIRKVTSVGVVSTLAGSAGSSGSADGVGITARFYVPRGVAMDNAGNIYVAEDGNHTIRKITSAGIVSTLAGLAGTYGTNDGAGSNARFNGPEGVAVDGAGNVYVADTYNLTIRKITLAGLVSTLAGKAGYTGSIDGVGSSARFSMPQGIAVDAQGTIYVADSGNSTIRKITPEGLVSTLAGKAGYCSASDGAGSDARFCQPTGVAVDSAGYVYVADYQNFTIRKITPAGVVSTLAGLAGVKGIADAMGSDARFNWPFGVAVDSAGYLYVTDGDNDTIRKVTPAGAVSTLAGLAGTRGAVDGTGREARFDNPEGIAVDSAGNVYVADANNNTIRKGVFLLYEPANPVSSAQPPASGQLMVTLLPPEINGQWRFPWELNWHSSGEVVSNLVAGNYPLEFRRLAEWLAYPPTVTAVVNSGQMAQCTNQYYPTLNLTGTTNTGSLTVNLWPSPTGAGWRFLGETAWRGPGSTATNLLPDAYFIEYAPVSGYCQHACEAVRVSGGSITVVYADYLRAQPKPNDKDLPVPVPADSISDVANYPYGFNGQLQSDVGYGSGVAVQTNVVLTAAHLVFSDDTLSYVNQVYWRWRQESGVSNAQPQAARGWYVLSGYAAQRTNDLQGGLYPGQSSPQSRNLDVAALYFPAPVAGGGYGGYLPSDAPTNIWLTGTAPKMLVGYPVDGSSLGDASIVPGVMYQAGPHPYPLSLAPDQGADPKVYLASWLLSYPGNSGGPLYVELGGYYYPAGVYLGTLYSGVVPSASLVRGIDSNVVNLITRAQVLGDSGTNYTGGGVITITVGAGGGSLAYVQVDIQPQAAVSAGAQWRLQGASGWNPTSPFTVTVAPGDSATLEFKQITGWNQPVNSTLQVTAGSLKTISATYTLNPARLAVTPSGGLAASGLAGGPFSPSSTSFTLTNSGGANLSWAVSKNATWLSLSPSNGTLAAGGRTNVLVAISSGANSLGAGSYTDTVGFTNISSGLGNTTRTASLTVALHPPVLLANPRVLGNGSLSMVLQGVTNRVYAILGSTNLLQPLGNWAEVLRLTNTTGQSPFTNPAPSSAAPQFYRAREL